MRRLNKNASSGLTSQYFSESKKYYNTENNQEEIKKLYEIRRLEESVERLEKNDRNSCKIIQAHCSSTLAKISSTTFKSCALIISLTGGFMVGIIFINLFDKLIVKTLCNRLFVNKKSVSNDKEINR